MFSFSFCKHELKQEGSTEIFGKYWEEHLTGASGKAK